MPLTYEDLNDLNAVFGGTKPLQVGIADYILPPSGMPTLPANMEFLERFAKMFSQHIDPDALGLLVTPEYYVAHKTYHPSQPPTSQPAKSFVKERLQKISENYPNVILNPTGFYEAPVKTLEKYQEEAANLKKFKNTNAPLMVHSKDPSLNPMTHNYIPPPNSNFMSYGINDPTELGSTLPRNPSLPHGATNIFKPKTLKNQNHYYWKGDKIGSYKKSSYYNEINNDFNKIDPNISNNSKFMLYSVGDRNMKTYHHPTSARANEELAAYDYAPAYISNLLKNNIHPEICYDHNGHFPCDSNKKIFTIQSENVGLPQTPPLPLSIYADSEALRHYNPTQRNFGALQPFSPSNKTTVPNFGFWPVVQQYSSSSNSSHSSSAPAGGVKRVPLKYYDKNADGTHHGFIFHPTTLG